MNNNTPQQLALPELTRQEAQALTDQIKATADSLWALLERAHKGRAWKALGYSTWEAYVRTEFSMTRRRSYQVLDQSYVIRSLQEAAGVLSTNVDGTNIVPTTYLSPYGDKTAPSEKGVHTEHTLGGPLNENDLCTSVHISEAEARDIKKVLPEVTASIREQIESIPEPQRARAAPTIVQRAVEKARADIAAIDQAVKENREVAQRLNLKEEPGMNERIAITGPLYRAVESLVEMPDAAEVAKLIKPYEMYRLERLSDVIAWLQKLEVAVK